MQRIQRRDIPKRLLRAMRSERKASHVRWTAPFFHCHPKECCVAVAYGLVPSGSERHPPPQHLPQLRRWGRRLLRRLKNALPTMKIHTLGYIRAPSAAIRVYFSGPTFLILAEISLDPPLLKYTLTAMCQDILLSHTRGCIMHHHEPSRGGVAFVTFTEVMPINDPTSIENKKGDDGYTSTGHLASHMGPEPRTTA